MAVSYYPLTNVVTWVLIYYEQVLNVLTEMSLDTELLSCPQAAGPQNPGEPSTQPPGIAPRSGTLHRAARERAPPPQYWLEKEGRWRSRG